MIAEFKGLNGKIIVSEDHLTISRATFGGFVSQGGSSGERKYFYRDINGVEYKRPTLLANGYIKVIVAGTTETNAKVGLFGSSLDSIKDQNTVALRAFSSKVGDETDKFYSLILEKISQTKHQLVANQPQSGSSKMDELKKLGELKSSGILTEDEFQREKERILNDK